MKSLKRMAWWIGLNIAMVITIGIIAQVFGLNHYRTLQGLNYGTLMAYCLLWGFGASFLSLAVSRMVAKWMMGVKVIDPLTASGPERELLERVLILAQKANLPNPEVGIYDSHEVNAFATGPSRSRALVAVSSGLLARMSSDEVDGVLAHEVSHIANGDMVTMTLLQGVINAFVMFFARVLATTLSQMVDEEKRYWVRYLVVIAFEIVFGILGSIILAAFSRRREFKADQGSAQLSGKAKMVSALRALKRLHEIPSDDRAPALASFKISNGGKTGFLSLFATHPSLDERIAALQES